MIWIATAVVLLLWLVGVFLQLGQWVNLLLLAPAALQLAHLALADALWLATVLVAYRSRA